MGKQNVQTKKVYWGHCKLKLTINTNQVKCWFLRRGETGVPGENLSVQSREPTSQPTYDAESGNRTRATLVGDECSPHCAIIVDIACGLHATTIFTPQEINIRMNIIIPTGINVLYCHTEVACFSTEGKKIIVEHSRHPRNAQFGNFTSLSGRGLQKKLPK